MNESPLKEFRCAHCNKLFFKGDIKHAIIEIKCRNCKQISKIEAAGCGKWIETDGGETPAKSDGKNDDSVYGSRVIPA